MMNKLVYALILLAFISLGCKDKVVTDKKSVAQKPVATSSAASATVQKEEPKVEKEIYVYDPQGRRDPFCLLFRSSSQKLKEKKERAL